MSTSGEDSDVVLVEGAWGRVVAVRLASGEVPAEDFLDGLDARSQAQFQVRTERLAAVGRITNDHQFKLLKSSTKPTVAEIKLTPGPGYRVYAVQQGRTWFVTHGGIKPKNNKLYEPEIQRAREIFAQRKALV